MTQPAPDPEPATAADRRRVLAGLRGPARQLAARILAEYGDWSTPKLETLRLYSESCARLAALREAGPGDDSRALHREVRTNLALLKALNLGD